MSRQKWLVSATLIFALLFTLIFLPLLRNADQKIISLGGDGGKNTYTYLYHVLYGKGFWFDGMNYPFGEHVVFTDNQPALSVPMAALNKHLNLSPGTILAVMYYLLVLSFVVGAVYSWRLLLHFRVHPAFALFLAALITLLSPQAHRLSGHFPLAYACFLPMLFFWTVRYREAGRPRELIRIFLLLLLFAFLHLYFLVMGLLWVLAYSAGSLLLEKKPLRQKLRHSGGIAGVAIAAFVLMQLFFRATDPVHDRPTVPLPYGANSPLWEIGNSSVSPFWQWIKTTTGWPNELKHPGEGGAYLGLATFALLITGLVLWLYRRYKKAPAISVIPPIWLFLGATVTIAVLLIPTIWETPPLDRLLQSLRQFRTLTRFTWIGYHVFAIYTGVLLWQGIRYFWQGGRKVLTTVVLLLLSVVWGVEAWYNAGWVWSAESSWGYNYETFLFKGKTDWNGFLKQHGQSAKEYQAILTLPYIHVGSEKIAPSGNDTWPLTLAYMAAVQLHLPIMDVCLSRSGWQQTFDQVKIDGGILTDKPVLKKISHLGPILLLHFRESPVMPEEMEIYASSDSLGEFGSCNVYRFWPDRYLKQQRLLRENLRTAMSTQVGTDSLRNSRLPFFLEHFEKEKSSIRFAGESMPAIKGADSVIAIWQVPPEAGGQSYEFSAWARYPEKGFTYNYYKLYFENITPNQGMEFDISGKNSLDNAPGLWFHTRGTFIMQPGTRTLKVQVINPGGHSYLAMDELMIRPTEGLVTSRLPDGTWLVNNHVLSRSKK